ncbi:MAG: thermonuclease family protein [Clostridia bacterium]|nr:thermonuclease family protein [Clostridia bacterium]
MRKIILILSAMLLISLSGCGLLPNGFSLDASPEESSQPEEIYETSEQNESTAQIYYDGPTLPAIDFTGMDLFEDGYEIVAFDYAHDGDTAYFLVGGSTLKTRFLGVDTTEIKTDSGVPEDWAEQARDYTAYILETADEIILELDENSSTFDDYDRLLAWIWADGRLLNYMLAAEGFAEVKYLYDDYKYNDYLLDAEYAAQKSSLRLWGDDEPYFNPQEAAYTYQDEENDHIGSIAAARNMSLGTEVSLQGIITCTIGKSAFLQDETGGIYLYSNNKGYYALEAGNEITIEGKLSDYNDFLEVTDFDDSSIKILSENNTVSPQTIALKDIGESMEGKYVQLNDVTITYVDSVSGENGYSVFVSKDGAVGEIRVDKYLSPYPDSSIFVPGDIISVVGCIGQHYDAYQLMISGEDAIIH